MSDTPWPDAHYPGGLLNGAHPGLAADCPDAACAGQTLTIADAHANAARMVREANERTEQAQQQLRAVEERARKAERAVNLLAGSHRRAERAEAIVDAVRDLAEAAIRYDDIPQDRLARRILAELGDPQTPDESVYVNGVTYPDAATARAAGAFSERARPANPATPESS